MLEGLCYLPRAVLAGLVSVCFIASAHGQRMGSAPPIDADAAKSKTGEFLVRFTEKSPESAISKIHRRMGLAPQPPAEDYDLSKEVFDVYVPQKPADDGNFGVMVSMCFPNHQWPPDAWKPVLEEYHLIWIGVTVMTDPRPVEQHAGILLDAAYNARRLWPTNSDRIYLATSTGERPICGLAFYYSDVFNGTIISPGLSWFFKIKDQDPKVGFWSTDNMARPQPADWDRAKNKSRFFLALNDSADDDAMRGNDVIVHLGYKANGFAHVKYQRVKSADMQQYTDWQSNWFERGVVFLDATVAPASQPAVVISKETSAKANSALEMAHNYMTVGKVSEARTRYQQIVQNYPGTAAAKQAAAILKQLAQK